MTFLLSLQAVGILLAMAVPGFLMGKSKKVDTKQAIRTLSVILLYVCQPFINVNSFLNTAFSKEILLNMVFIFIITAILMTGLLFLGELVFIKDKGTEKRDVYAFAGGLGNIGYMCIPFLQVLTNNDQTVILYAATSIVAMNLVAWTLGSYLITRDKKHISIKNAVLNPPTISFLLVLPFFILNLNFLKAGEALSAVANACSLFANLTAPLSMMILGLQFADAASPKAIFTDWRSYVSCGLKLVVSPLIAIALYYLFNLFVDLSAIKLNVIALAAMPSATILMMFCSLYNKNGNAAAGVVLLSSVLSIVTIPLFLMLV